MEYGHYSLFAVSTVALIFLLWQITKNELTLTPYAGIKIILKLNKIMSTQAELTAQVNSLTAKVEKIGTETRSLLTKIDELTEIINQGDEVTPELQAAVDALGAQADVVDGLVPDAPAEEPSEEPTE